MYLTKLMGILNYWQNKIKQQDIMPFNFYESHTEQWFKNVFECKRIIVILCGVNVIIIPDANKKQLFLTSPLTKRNYGGALNADKPIGWHSVW